MSLIDQIERYIFDLLAEQACAEFNRNDLARHFGCSPAQINYVIQRRFECGFSVETRRGSGGYIRIVRLDPDIRVDPAHVQESIRTLFHIGYLSERESLILLNLADLFGDQEVLARRITQIINHPLFR